MSSTETDYLHIVTQDKISARRRDLGRLMIWGSATILIVLISIQSLDQFSSFEFGFKTWRPTLYAYFFWATCLCWAQVILYGEQGKRRLFILPAVLFVVSMVIFPLIFALGIAFQVGICLLLMGVNSMVLIMLSRCGAIHFIGMH